jgi:hypothetical protein
MDPRSILLGQLRIGAWTLTESAKVLDNDDFLKKLPNCWRMRQRDFRAPGRERGLVSVSADEKLSQASEENARRLSS